MALVSMPRNGWMFKENEVHRHNEHFLGHKGE